MLRSTCSEVLNNKCLEIFCCTIFETSPFYFRDQQKIRRITTKKLNICPDHFSRVPFVRQYDIML